MDPVDQLKKNIAYSIAAAQNLIQNEGVLAEYKQAVQAVVTRYKQGGRLYIAGNGGSAADAQHLAAEFVSKLAKDRAPLPAEALTVDSSIITAIGNDYGYDNIFSRQLSGKATIKDIFLGITTSGESQNILNALNTCRDIGIPSIVFCGKDGGQAKNLADFCIIVPGIETSTIQELHIILAHTLCGCVESTIFEEKSTEKLQTAEKILGS